MSALNHFKALRISYRKLADFSAISYFSLSLLQKYSAIQ